MGKIETARSELLIADHFMSCIEGFCNLQGVQEEEEFLIVYMPKAMKATDETWNKAELFEQLKAMDSFSGTRTSRVFNDKPTKCWHFKNSNK